MLRIFLYLYVLCILFAAVVAQAFNVRAATGYVAALVVVCGILIVVYEAMNK